MKNTAGPIMENGKKETRAHPRPSAGKKVREETRKLEANSG